MELNADQRRAVIAICCAVARADGEVSPPEVEKLFDILARFGEGHVALTELQRWLDEGPPEIETRFAAASARAGIQEALAVANADGKVDDVEVKTIKRLFEHYVEKSA